MSPVPTGRYYQNAPQAPQACPRPNSPPFSSSSGTPPAPRVSQRPLSHFSPPPFPHPQPWPPPRPRCCLLSLPDPHPTPGHVTHPHGRHGSLTDLSSLPTGPQHHHDSWTGRIPSRPPSPRHHPRSSSHPSFSHLIPPGAFVPPVPEAVFPQLSPWASSLLADSYSSFTALM